MAKSAGVPCVKSYQPAGRATDQSMIFLPMVRFTQSLPTWCAKLHSPGDIMKGQEPGHSGIQSHNSDTIKISSDAESLKVVATVKHSAHTGSNPTPHRKKAPSLMYMKKIVDNFDPFAQRECKHDL